MIDLVMMRQRVDTGRVLQVDTHTAPWQEISESCLITAYEYLEGVHYVSAWPGLQFW